jgi:hypothetical protein
LTNIAVTDNFKHCGYVCKTWHDVCFIGKNNIFDFPNSKI